MEHLFLTILNMSFAASWAILMLIFLRPLLKRIPRWITCLLWAVPVLRLLCPVTLESALSLMPVKSQSLPQNIAMQHEPQIDSGSAIVDSVVNDMLESPAFTPNMGDSVNPLQVYQFIGTCLWVIGMVVLAGYSILSIIRLKKRLKGVSHKSDNIYSCANLETAFVVGLIKPKIYLPEHIEDSECIYILQHEKMHIRRKDHLFKAAAFLAVTVHWFNPLAWLMFILLTRDMEMACDEAVLSKMGEDSKLKKAYSTSLLNMAAGGRILAGTPLAFGEGDVSRRVKNVLTFKRPKTWVAITALLLCLFLAAGLLTDRLDSRLQIYQLESLDDLGESAIKGNILLWYKEARHDAGVIHTYPLKEEYVGPKEDGYLVYYHHGTDHYSWFEIEARAKGDKIEFDIIEHDAVSEGYMSSEAFAIVTFEEGEFPLDDIAIVDEEAAADAISNLSSPLRPYEAQNMAYIKALDEILKEGVYPDGTIMPSEVISDIAEITFAVYDVDCDGSDELILNFMGGPMAAKATQIYAYDGENDSLRLEITAFPKLTYYTNGYIEAGWSHNQGRAGNRDDFWPYTLYCYNPKGDYYSEEFHVDAWDKQMTETGPNGMKWPEDADKEESGIVYWIMTGNTDYSSTNIYSVAEYVQFRDEILGDAKIVDITFNQLTTENIATVAMPRIAAN